MNNLNEFPLNFIRKDKTTVYWLIQHAIKEILEEDKEMAKEMAFELRKVSLLFHFIESTLICLI